MSEEKEWLVGGKFTDLGGTPQNGEPQHCRGNGPRRGSSRGCWGGGTGVRVEVRARQGYERWGGGSRGQLPAPRHQGRQNAGHIKLERGKTVLIFQKTSPSPIWEPAGQQLQRVEINIKSKRKFRTRAKITQIIGAEIVFALGIVKQGITRS